MAKKRDTTARKDVPDLRDRLYEPALIPLKDELDPWHAQTPVTRDDILDQSYEGACTGFSLAAVINRLHRCAGRDVRVRLMDHTTFADLGLDVVVDLTEEPQRFSIDFTVPAGLDSTNARLTFWMGPFDAPGTTYTYDAVGIDEVCGVTNLVP